MDLTNKISIKRNNVLNVGDSQVPVKKSKLDEVDEDPENVDSNDSTSAHLDTVPNQDEKVNDSADRIKARASRFGGFQSDAAKKAARAERFAQHLQPKEQSGPGKESYLEKLKKREEKFGNSSSAASKISEQSEILKKRKERFGEVHQEDAEKQEIKTIKNSKTIKRIE
jgi:hypothetical protein